VLFIRPCYFVVIIEYRRMIHTLTMIDEYTICELREVINCSAIFE